jgi:hypothetical protein
LIEDALKLNPNDVANWNRREWIALMCYKPERSIQSFQYGLVLDPMTIMRGISWNGMAFAYFILGQYDKGREFAEKSVQLVADVHSLPALIANEVRSGRLADARQRAVQLPGFAFAPSVSRTLGRIPPALGRYAARSRDIGMNEQRRLAAIVSADVAGYSRLWDATRPARWRRFRSATEQQCTSSKIAQMRIADWVRKGLPLGVDRTYGGLHETDASDPKPA